MANGSLLQLAGLPSRAPPSPGGRLRYVGSAGQWQFAINAASHDDYGESVFPTGLPIGTCQDGLDTSCGLDVNNPTAWTGPPTNLWA
jgi:hypothetical protein